MSRAFIRVVFTLSCLGLGTAVAQAESRAQAAVGSSNANAMAVLMAGRPYRALSVDGTEAVLPRQRVAPAAPAAADSAPGGWAPLSRARDY